MPELPEVETTLRGIEPHLVGTKILAITVRESRLRQPVSPEIDALCGAKVMRMSRRAKYLIAETDKAGCLIIHLGMSGSLRVVSNGEDYRKHDHIILTLPGDREIRYHDPRRFGMFVYLAQGDPLAHPLLVSLGPEPLSDDFDADHLHLACKNRTVPIKQLIMDGKVVVGVGNIYASEALFLSGIRPSLMAKSVSMPKLKKLVSAIKKVLAESIEQGGTTLRDFVNSDGAPGYFRQRLHVYDREGENCHNCSSPIRRRVMGQRATYWCAHCQK